FGRVDPALQVERLLLHGALVGCGDGDGAAADEVFGAARPGEDVGAGLQRHGFAVGAVDLRVEVEVGRQAARHRRIGAAAGVGDGERRHDRLAVALRFAVVVVDAELDQHGGGRVEHDIN